MLLVAGPLLTDLLSVLFVFWMTLHAMRGGYAPRSLAWIGGLFAVGYIVGTQIAGRWLNERRASRMVLAAVPILAALGTAAILLPSFALHLVLVTMVGATAGHYFTPFQVMMGNVRPFHTLAWTIAFYNISWGTGYTLGPLVSGLASDAALSHEPGRIRLALVGVVWLVAAIHTVLTLAAQSRWRERRMEGIAHIPEAFTSTQAMRRSGFISAVAVTIVAGGMLTTVWPSLGAARGLTDRQIAVGGALLAAPIPLLAMLWARLRHLMIHKWLLLAQLLLCAVAVALVPVTHGQATLVCLACLGIGYSGVVFHGIYYSNANPRPGANVTIYETVVGVGSFAGPVLMGSLAWTDRASIRPYIFGAATLLLAVALVAYARRKDSVTPEAHG